MNTILDPNQATALTNSNPQHDFLLLDASSSMASRWWESLEAIDAYVAGLQSRNVDSLVTLATFTTNHDRETGHTFMQYDIARDATPKTWPSVVAASPDMWANSTPLYDAINTMARSLRDLNPSRCSVVIITDGEENASTVTSAAQARALLDWMRSRGWQVTFMGCDFDNSRQAKLLGANDANTVGTSAKRLKDATSSLAEKRAHHAKHGTPMHFSESERARFGGYLTSGC